MSGNELADGRGSTIGLAGCGIWLFFAVIFGMRPENRGGKWEFQLRAGAGFRVFMGLRCEIARGTDFINWPAQKPQSGTNEPFVRTTVSGFKSTHYRLAYVSIRPYEVYESYCDLLCWPLTSVHF